MTAIPTPTALPAHTVSLLLQYLTPLDNRIPSHLLSAPLRQRHHFLGLDPQDDALAYLSWPSSSTHSSKLYSLLAGLPSAEDVDPHAARSARYTHDGESYFAHVHIDSPTYSLSYSHDDTDSADGLRFIFRWEPEDASDALDGSRGWKYHDVQTMPFPDNSSTSPNDVNASDARIDAERVEVDMLMSTAIPGNSRETTGAHFLAHTSESDDDDYWNSYGGYASDGDDGTGHRGRAGSRRSALADDEKAEDAYWAQYASVQGTADSTIPTPPPQGRRRLDDPSQPLPFLDDARHLSPNDLAYRLQTMSPRLPPSPSPVPSGAEAHNILTDNTYDLASPSDTSGTSATNESSTATPPPLSSEPVAVISALESPRPIKPIDVPFLARTSELVDNASTSSELDTGLRDTIKGVFKLWSASRSQSKHRSQSGDASASATSMTDKDAFVQAVRQVIGSL